MTTVIEYAMLAGASYYDTRADLNRFPLPEDWSYFSRVPQDTSTGFEATAFQKVNANGSTEIVISYAGTDPSDWYGDIPANLGLAAGLGSSQLLQAAQYYLLIKANAPANTTISFTGHSLGGGLASLMAVFFGGTATTFDQAPFRNSASVAVATAKAKNEDGTQLLLGTDGNYVSAGPQSGSADLITGTSTTDRGRWRTVAVIINSCKAANDEAINAWRAAA